LELEDLEIVSPELENHMLETFGDRFIGDAMRIVQTKQFTVLDGPMVHEAMCLVVAMYIRKIKTGEINTDRVLH